MKTKFNTNNLCKSGRLLLAGFVALTMLPVGFSGCVGGKAAAASNGAAPAAANAGEEVYQVSADATPFYRYGPQQPNGPDLSLKKGARVVVLKRSYGYSQVRTADKQVGFVGTEDIAPLSAQELAAERAAALAAQNPKPSSAIVGRYTIPAEAGSQERLPEPEVKPTPNPAMFRY